MINKFRYILRNRLVRSMEKNDITMEQLKTKVKDGAILIDVRSPQEYKEGHIEGSVLIPEYELKTKVEELPNKEDTIIIYCSSGIRSKKAQRKLQKMGYINVYNLYGGLDNAN